MTFDLNIKWTVLSAETDLTHIIYPNKTFEFQEDIRNMTCHFL